MQMDERENDAFFRKAKKILSKKIQEEAAWALEQDPLTVTSYSSPRSAGGKHDFFSEGDYWWPNSISVDSPYIQRDGMTNPDNFVEHRKAMIRFSRIMGALGSAYIISHNDKYVVKAMQHARAWFVDVETKMNPHLLYAQAIKGRFTGRGIGIIDTIHLLEVVKALMVMEGSSKANKELYISFRLWFDEYLRWMTTHPYGLDEMKAQNNHGTCWVMQVAGFAQFIENDSLMKICIKRFKEVLLPNQMAMDGSFPKEMARTKPYGYSIFNLDAMSTICQILSKPEDDLWNFTLPDGRSMRKAIDFLYPFIKNKSDWKYKPDVMYMDQWPVAQPFLVFGANTFHNYEYFKLWSSLNHVPRNDEVIRNLPIRNVLLWL